MRTLTVDSLNPAINDVQYAACGELAIKAENAMADLAPGVFPKDVIARANELSDEISSIGAYSDGQGILLIRKNVAKFIEDDIYLIPNTERDGYPSDPNHIFLTTGASAGHYGVSLPYYLDELSGWSTSVTSIEAAIEEAEKGNVAAKALVIINPSNPTGAVLDKATQEQLVKLCEKHSLVLLADEVYQVNLHQPQNYAFTSFKEIVSRLQSPVPLVSFHSLSKGVYAEGGRRGGYFECTNISEEVIALIYKMVSAGSGPPISGQIGVDCMVRPPKPGDESYELWKKETDTIHANLASRMGTIASRLNALPGVSCVDSPGALYLFPGITFSEKAQEAARAVGKDPDVFYALGLLDETGICVEPGSVFGQKEGEWHYRLTCLCPGVDEYIGRLVKFHRGFVEKYGL
ncbi:alanine aminotransferase [Pluteus cervinus]|uniref:Alanine aminotransferase n=1 Tax=Pluteus cervinus TaxID=181527 RepID=A0ACD3B973_9AGAR|nr:alanine aminotransferase [Pluteus cervinus]